VLAEVFRKKKEDTVGMNDAVAVAANLIAEPARAAMLLELMSGRALPAGELAEAANVTPQTASGHLAKLVEGRFLRVEQQGRHRYYSLASTEVAGAVEALLVLTSGVHKMETRVPAIGSLEHARTCYSHLAGWLGVQVTDALQANGFLQPASRRAFVITQRGRKWFEDLGIEVGAVDQANLKIARQCIDWTERRLHVAGELGVGMYRRFVALKWIVPARNTRAVRVTLDGKRELWRRLRIAIR
jgi:DNA-binding transcriptional ArsR family regulator